MNSVIESDDKIWNVFLGYANLISSEANKLGMDIYGTEQRTSIATSLTLSHMLDQVVTQLKEAQRKESSTQRSKHYTRDFFEVV
jgi:hypothetical protein